MASEAQRRAAQKYKASMARQFSLCLLKNKDEDIIAKLDTVSNKQGYIKDLIRADIASAQKEEGKTMEDMTICSGYTPDGKRFELILSDQRLYMVTENGGERFNDEYYEADDWTALQSVKDGLISEGYNVM